MGNCASSFNPLEEDPDEAWKRQTRGQTENKLYTIVDLKGAASTAELVQIYKQGRREALLDRLRNSNLLAPYLYDRGKGKIVTTEDLSLYENERQTRKERGAISEETIELDNRQACWSLQQRGTLGETALHLCFLNNTPKLHIPIAHVLLEVYPAMALDMYEGDEFHGETAVHIATVNGATESVKLLIEQCGADIHARAKGRFFLPEDCKESLSEDTDYQGYAYYGEYPLSFAACFENTELYDYLVRKGADPNLKDTFGNTVLHLCVIHNKPDMYTRALHRKHKLRADPNIKNYAGLTPLTLAAHLGRKEMFHEILELANQEYWSYGRITCCGYPLEQLDSIGQNGKTDERSALMITLSGNTEDHLDMLNCGIIYRLLKEKWETFARRKFYIQLLFAVIYLAFFSLSIYLRPRHLDMKRIETGTDKLRIACESVTALGAIVYLVHEIKDVLISQGWKAQLNSLRGSPGKTLFLLSCILVVIMLPCRYAGALTAETGILIVAAPMAWCYLLFFCRGFETIGPFVDMIYRMFAGDMSRFFIIYLIFLCGLAQAFTHLMKGINGFESEIYTIMTLMRMTFGEFDYFDFEKSKYPTMAKLTFFYFMLFVAVLLMNMLIAMMGNTYQNISDRSEKEWRRQWAHIIVVLERSVKPAQAIKLQDSYSVAMKTSGGSHRKRGLMIIKKSHATTKSDKRKAAVLSWRLVRELTMIKKEDIENEVSPEDEFNLQVLGKNSIKSQLVQQASTIQSV